MIPWKKWVLGVRGRLNINHKLQFVPAVWNLARRDLKRCIRHVQVSLIMTCFKTPLAPVPLFPGHWAAGESKRQENVTKSPTPNIRPFGGKNWFPGVDTSF